MLILKCPEHCKSLTVWQSQRAGKRWHEFHIIHGLSIHVREWSSFDWQFLALHASRDHQVKQMNEVYESLHLKRIKICINLHCKKEKNVIWYFMNGKVSLNFRCGRKIALARMDHRDEPFSWNRKTSHMCSITQPTIYENHWKCVEDLFMFRLKNIQLMIWKLIKP